MSALPAITGKHSAYDGALGAERQLLGGVLQEPSWLPRLAHIRPQDFYRPDHGALWMHLQGMVKTREVIDLTTLPRKLSELGVARRCGGLEYVMELPSFTPSTTNLEHYAHLVQQSAAQRLVVKAGEALTKAPHSEEAITHGLALIAEARSLSGVRGEGPIAGGEVIEKTMAELQEQWESGATPGMGTALAGLDQLVQLRPKKQSIVAARPGMGKTAFAMHLMMACLGLLDDREPQACGAFLLEMDETEFGRRLLSNLSGVDYGRLEKPHTLTRTDWAKLADAEQELKGFAHLWWIDPTPGLTAEQIVARTRAQHAKQPVDLLITDYVQLVSIDGGRRRTEAIGDVSKALLNTAKALGFHSCLLAQLNREVDKRALIPVKEGKDADHKPGPWENARPVMSDLRDSGQLEQDASQVIFLLRPSRYFPDNLAISPEMAEIIVAKNRQGTTGIVPAWFRGVNQEWCMPYGSEGNQPRQMPHGEG